MFNRHKDKTLERKSGCWTRAVLTWSMWLAILGLALPVVAQDQPGQQPATQAPDSSKPKQEVPAEAGGPTDNIGPYAIPKKKTEDAPPPPPPVAPKKLDDIPDYSLKVNVPLVNVDVLVTTKMASSFPA